jgi:hypothetical protein
MSQQDSFALADDCRLKILSRRRDSLDTCIESYKSYSSNDYRFIYRHTRPLPRQIADKAIRYIISISKKYPFQVRMQIAMPLWDRFCQEWCETGDDIKSLKAV